MAKKKMGGLGKGSTACLPICPTIPEVKRPVPPCCCARSSLTRSSPANGLTTMP